ncbi:toprim domain-containing protein [Candidatus Micrarchaeota archaeon]|nr:toprim domain-containing protein [Candidatus Micrarchaeota archaeon]
MNSVKKLDLLEKTLSKLAGKTILVEGKKDKLALEKLVDAKIETAVGKPFQVINKLSSKKVVLLFDFDEEGKRKTSFFKQFLEENGFSVDTSIALRLRSCLGFLYVEDAYVKYEKLLGEKNG